MSVTAFLLLVMAVGLQAAKVPSFQLSQDQYRVYVYIMAQCTSNKEVSSDAENFHFSCDAGDTQYELKFQLREDIIPGLTRCMEDTKGGRENCVLVKKEAHTFDRCLENPKPFKGLMQESDPMDEHEVAEDEIENAFSDSAVTVLTKPKQLNLTLANHEIVVFFVQYRWCVRCRTAYDSIMDIAKRLKGQIPFAAIDALENRQARHYFQPSCVYTCPLHVYRRGEGVYPVIQSMTRNHTVMHLKGFLRPLLTNITSEAELDTFRKEASYGYQTVVGVFEDPASAEAQAFREAGKGFRVRIPFGLATQPVGPLAPSPSIHFFRGDDVPVTYHGNLSSPLDIARFVNFSSRPLIFPYSADTRRELEDAGIPGLLFLSKPDDAESAALKETITQLSKEMEGRLYFVEVNASDKTRRNIPEGAVVVLQESFDGRALRFVHEGPLTLEAIRETCNKMLDGTLKTYDSEAVPEEAWEVGQLKKVVRRTLDDEVSGDNTLLLAFYKPDVKEWKQFMKPTLEKTAQLVKEVPGLVLGQFDLTKNNFPKWLPYAPYEETAEWFSTKTSSRPLLLLIPAGFDPLKMVPTIYHGKIAQEAILEWMRQYIPAMEGQWEAITDEVKRIKEEREAQKKAAAEARRKAKAAADHFDVTEDGGVHRQVMQPGAGPTPQKGEGVEFHYVGTNLENGAEFENTQDNGKPVRFTLGAGEVVPCWELAFPTMQVGERAILTCKPEYAHGGEGSHPKVTADATLQYDVQFLAIHPAEKHDEL